MLECPDMTHHEDLRRGALDRLNARVLSKPETEAKNKILKPRKDAAETAVAVAEELHEGQLPDEAFVTPALPFVGEGVENIGDEQFYAVLSFEPITEAGSTIPGELPDPLAPTHQERRFTRLTVILVPSMGVEEKDFDITAKTRDGNEIRGINVYDRAIDYNPILPADVPSDFLNRSQHAERIRATMNGVRIQLNPTPDWLKELKSPRR